jgi:hypothetical protein
MATSRIDGRAILAGITSLALIGSLFLVLRAPAALAEEQNNNEYPSVPCGTGDTREEAWHWVHNQVPDGVTSATLTASFEVLTGPDTGSIIQLQVVGEIGNGVIHYDLFYPYGLELLPTPSDDVTGGQLVLSHWPQCSDDTTTTTEATTTSTTEATTTSTTEPTTTSTTDPYVTTTTQATTTTSEQSTSTSTTEATTTTTEATTTTTEEETTTTEEETTTTEEETTTTTLPDEVSDSDVTTTTEPDEVSPTVLPFTGIDSDSIFVIALILISTGVLTVVFVRGTKEWGES